MSTVVTYNEKKTKINFTKLSSYFYLSVCFFLCLVSGRQFGDPFAVHFEVYQSSTEVLDESAHVSLYSDGGFPEHVAVLENGEK